MHTSKTSQGSFALKLEMSKAYDRIGWDFLKHALTSVGVIYNAQELIMSCVQTASFAILLNGHPKGFFMGERGIIQGCPLSAIPISLYYLLALPVRYY